LTIATSVSGYLNNVWQKDDLIVLVHIPESPSLPPLSFKGIRTFAFTPQALPRWSGWARLEVYVAPSYAEAKKLKLLALHTSVSLRNAAHLVPVIENYSISDVVACLVVLSSNL